jgi:uncharacterized membrane protein
MWIGNDILLNCHPLLSIILLEIHIINLEGFMVIWGVVLFGLGILSFLDTAFGYGNIFRGANSILFLLVSLGILTRTRNLERLRYKEELLESKKELQAHFERMKESQESPEKEQMTQGEVVEQ